MVSEPSARRFRERGTDNVVRGLVEGGRFESVSQLKGVSSLSKGLMLGLVSFGGALKGV